MNAPNGSMRIIAWNCKGLEGPSTISQLKELIRLNLHDLIFVCETKQSTGYVGIVCKKLRYEKGGKFKEGNEVMLVVWTKKVEIKQVGKLIFTWNCKLKMRPRV